MAQDGAFGLVANTDTKLLIYHLFQKVRILALDGLRQRYAHGTRACLLEAVCSVTLDLRSEGISAISRMCTLQISGWSLARKRRCCTALAESEIRLWWWPSPGRRTRVVIPPQRNATLSQNSNTAMQERDRHIRAIEKHGRREWYKLSGYTKRSMVENAVYRYKAIIGPEMRARTLARQRVEHRIGCEILNKMAALGMPDTYCAG